MTVPYKYGPLVETGISYREIKRHNRYEIILMLKALDRLSVIRNGVQMSSNDKASMEQRSRNADIWMKYVEETEKYKRQGGPRIG